MSRRSEIQIQHETQSHHADHLYASIDNKFVESIEKQDHPERIYHQKMKHALIEELDHSLSNFNQKVEQAKSRFSNETAQDGVTTPLEKNKQEWKSLQTCLSNKQAKKCANFVDQSKIKETYISSFVQRNLNEKLFHIQAEKYQAKQADELRKTVNAVGDQQKLKDLQKIDCRLQKEQDKQIRHHHEEQIQVEKRVGLLERRENQQKYRSDLDKLVESNNTSRGYSQSVHMSVGQKREKSMSTAAFRDSSVFTLPKIGQSQRHNPITNPIEYQIQNPYILLRLQKMR